MTAHAHAEFEVTNWDEGPILDGADGAAKVTRAMVTMDIRGDLQGSGELEWLMAYAADGNATFVGLERVEATVGDRAGSFVLQHTGTFDGETAKAMLEIVTGSGTGELAGLNGSGTFEAGMGADGIRSLTLDYDL
jgi:hypothetical protein